MSAEVKKSENNAKPSSNTKQEFSAKEFLEFIDGNQFSTQTTENKITEKRNESKKDKNVNPASFDLFPKVA